MAIRGPSGFIVPLVYSDFFDNKPTREDLTRTVRRLHWQGVVKLCAGIASISWMRGVETESLQRDLVVELTQNLLYGSVIRSRLRDDPHTRLFTRESLLGLLRVAVVEESLENAAGSEYPDLFIRAILIVNELLAEELNPSPPSNSPKDLLASELRSVSIQIPNPHELLGRTEAFLKWSTGAVAASSVNRLPIEADLKRFTGLSPIENQAGAYSVLARFTPINSWREVEANGVAFDSDKWLAGLADTKVLRQWFSVNSMPISQAKLEWRGESSLSAVGARNLWRQPVVVNDDGLSFVPSPLMVVNAMGDGVYYALMDGYRAAAGNDKKARDRAVERFTQFYGEFFEDYVVDLFQRGYIGRKDAHVSGEVEYKKGVLSSDVIVTEANDILFIEVVAKRMGFIDSILRLSPETIGRDIEAGVIDKARQLQRNITDFRSGLLFPDCPRPQKKRIFPIIIAPNEWPRITIIDSILPVLEREEGLLADVEPLELFDAGEAEWLETALPSGLRLGELLNRKNRSTKQYRLMSLHNYLYYAEPGTSPGLVPNVRIRGGEVAKEIIGLVESWAATD